MITMYIQRFAFGRFPIETRKLAMIVPMYTDCTMVLATSICFNSKAGSSSEVVRTCKCGRSKNDELRPTRRS